MLHTEGDLMRFAAVDDEVSQLELIQTIISSMGHECHTYTTGNSLIKTLRRESYDFLLIDWELPDIKGPEIVKWVRENKSKTVPILFITNRRDERDVAYALSVGADDYIRKPIRIHEMVARIEALLRRLNPSTIQSKFSWGKYAFLPERQLVELNNTTITLKNREFELALFLFQNIGRLLSRQHLQEQLWGTQMTDVITRTLDTHISAVRNKLSLHPENGYHLVSVYGYGYRLETASTSD